ncbi:hypothetical protein JKP88DRAFT_253420 [Tribonema minus]|uniref:Uncharacterized protein n=1 Tax=Tribonema minus TaxID=303371 RepID=A0A835ZA23_9STRA|nr:hypothetical protein JKP88DRAFT_253420 [Tribonema minus]
MRLKQHASPGVQQCGEQVMFWGSNAVLLPPESSVRAEIHSAAAAGASRKRAVPKEVAVSKAFSNWWWWEDTRATQSGELQMPQLSDGYPNDEILGALSDVQAATQAARASQTDLRATLMDPFITKHVALSKAAEAVRAASVANHTAGEHLVMLESYVPPETGSAADAPLALAYVSRSLAVAVKMQACAVSAQSRVAHEFRKREEAATKLQRVFHLYMERVGTGFDGQ